MGDLTPQAFATVADLVRREAAIVIGPGKEYLVETRLAPLARAAGAADVTAYVSTLQSPAHFGRRTAVVEALTTNETSWFRDGEPFEALRTTVVPRLLRDVPATRPIRVWSAACSSGQEAYTIAMVLAEHAPARRVEILASDLSREMVERTRRGSYSQLEVGRGLPAPLMVEHFRRSGTQWQVSASLRSMVRAQRINLAAPWPPLPVFDVVFLRNVLIYLDTPTKQSILRRVRRVLTPDGYLFLGGAETTLGIDDSWDRTTVGRSSLYRPAAAPARPTTPPLPARAWAATAEGR
jgi:chemotaxis protein methyltransferase CheR